MTYLRLGDSHLARAIQSARGGLSTNTCNWFVVVCRIELELKDCVHTLVQKDVRIPSSGSGKIRR
jgi:hypothetical protein